MKFGQKLKALAINVFRVVRHRRKLGKYLNELEYQATNGFKIKDVPDSQGPNEYGDYQGTMSNHHKVYQNVIETLNGNESIDVNGIEGMKTVEIIEAAYKSVNEKKMIKI